MALMSCHICGQNISDRASIYVSMYTNERRKRSTYEFLHTNISVVGICTG